MERKSSSPTKINFCLIGKCWEIFERIKIADFVVIDSWSYFAFHLKLVDGVKLRSNG